MEGETGTGKELLAHTIHENSARKTGRFVVIDCGTLPESLIESELFGHNKGAFTSATEHRAGAFEAANGGTILLDEVENLTPSMQAKLLRILDTGQAKRVGSNHLMQLNVRVVATTNKNLSEMTEKGLFRRDLLYRLNMLTLLLPSLRERKEDIPLFVDFFLDEANKKFARNVTQVTSGALTVLKDFGWPGNIRELKHVIEQAVLLCEDATIDIDLLPDKIKDGVTLGYDGHLTQKLATVEKELIKQALRRYNGNKSAAARTLGVSRKGLRMKMRRYGLE